MQGKCLGGQLGWQDLPTAPGTCPATKAVSQRANIGQGTMPGSSHREYREGQVFVFQGGTQCSTQDLVLQVGLGVLVSSMLQARPTALGEMWCSKQNPVLQAGLVLEVKTQYSGYVKLCVFFSRGRKRKQLPGLAPQSVKLYVRHTQKERRRWRNSDTQLESYKVTGGERQRLTERVNRDRGGESQPRDWTQRKHRSGGVFLDVKGGASDLSKNSRAKFPWREPSAAKTLAFSSAAKDAEDRV